MRAKLDNLESGASSLSLELSTPEINSLIDALQKLRECPDRHFHYRSSFDKAGIGDIEFSCGGSQEDSYLQLDA